MTRHGVRDAAVVCADRFHLSGRAQAELGHMGGHAWADARDDRELAEMIGGNASVRVIVSEYVAVNGAVAQSAPALKGVIAYGAGYDHIDVEALRQRGVQVCNCRGENSRAVAELVFGLLLCLLRGIHRADAWIRAGEWPGAGRILPGWATGGELGGKTIGVVGLGHIGALVAGIARGFGMEVIGHDPLLAPVQWERLGVAPVSFSELMSRSDMVSLHVPLTPETETMVDSRALADAKPGLILVNTSRGRVLDEGALVEALRTGRVGGAALDVFAEEPLPPSHPLAVMENVILSPHLGAMTREAGDRLSDSVVRQARDILEGRLSEGLIRK